MCEIACSDNIQAFNSRPSVQRFKIKIFAGGSGIVRMKMEIGKIFHSIVTNILSKIGTTILKNDL